MANLSPSYFGMNDSPKPQVTTKNGEIQGIVETVQGQPVNLFLGIPFADPPVGSLRFMKPQPVSNWTGIRNTTAYGAVCMQEEMLISHGTQMSEDCLTLNVFVPGTLSNTTRKAVMVWIHGGGFMNGGTNVYHFHEFAIQGDVIVVSVNYRLGAFGFLSTGDVNAPGNAGLWDQIEGLKWVRDNIENFGGDPNNVTIFGESAGGSCISQLAMTLAARGLFRRFISMSGTALTESAWVKDGADIATKVGQNLGCNAEASEKANLAACLRDANATALLKASAREVFPRHVTTPFGPVVDGDMFPLTVLEMLKDSNSDVVRNFLSLDYMGGFTNSDAGVYLLVLPFNTTLGVQPSYMRDTLIPQFAAEVSSYHQDEIARRLRGLYYDASADMAETGRLMVNYYTDTLFAVPTVGFLRYHLMAPGGSTYLFYFTKEPSFPHLVPVPAWFEGANHGDDLLFMLGLEVDVLINNINFTEAEKNISRAFMTYFANFAKTGNPNTPDAVPSPWPSYTHADEAYLDIGDVILNETDVIPERIDLWLDTVPAIIAKPTTSAPPTTPVASDGNLDLISTILVALILLNTLIPFP
ncbi:carboxylesterase 1C [Lingula anatina]|uniref:Carboxylic ester hydrolase n=1 Tax=Lingula anatina TaxID=7574 RepID=A0A1S3IE97_LINAN|nr:carboxylesterase 1C [Lingula anatina]|eukprot:XP_013395779.1 carboxylesterase 1C [Lingula anatina]